MSQLKQRVGLAIACAFALVVALSITPVTADPPPPPPDGPRVVSETDDMNDDSVDDTVIADPSGGGASEPGKIEVVSGENESDVTIISGNEDNDKFGYAASTACDVNGDGVKDLLVGAPKEDEARGRAYVFFGPFDDDGNLTADDADLTLQSPDEDTFFFGQLIECVPDTNSDGFLEIMVEARVGSINSEERRAYIFSGANGEPIGGGGGTAGGPEGGGGLPPCFGDITGQNNQPDGHVDVNDLLILLGAWGACAAPCPPDLNADGNVDVNDLLIMIGAWGDCDHDGDGIPDYWEVFYGLDPYSDDGDDDADDDGVSNLEEFTLGTNPTDQDSDGDGTSDGQEVNQGSNPADPSDNGDPNPDDVIWVKVKIGDPGNGSCSSGIFSDLWAMHIGSVPYVATSGDFGGNPQTTNKTFVCGSFTGTGCGAGYKSVWIHTNPIPLLKGRSYAITVQHRGTCFTVPQQGDPDVNDYDFTADLTVVAPPGGGPIAAHILSDPQNLFDTYYDQDHSYQNMAANKTAHLHVPKLQLKSIAFNSHIIRHDTGTQAMYEWPQWLDANLDGDTADIDSADRDFPIAKTRNTAMEVVEVRFAAELGNLPTDGITVRAIASDDSVFEGDAFMQGGELVATGLVADQSLPNEISVEDEYSIQWVVDLPPPGGGQPLVYTDLTISESQLYVCRADPLGTISQCHTVWDISCYNAIGLGDDSQEVVNAIWSEFADRVVLRYVDFQPMKYYGTWQTCTAISTNALIAAADGQCGAWAHLLDDCLRIQGLDGDLRFIEGNDLILIDDFLVKNWMYQGNGLTNDSSFPYLNLPDDPFILANNTYDFLFAQVTDVSGIAGQSQANPASYFENHIVVKYNNELFDPSYGNRYADLAALELAAMAGFVRIANTQVNEADVGLDLNNNGVFTDTVQVLADRVGANPGGGTIDNLLEHDAID